MTPERTRRARELFELALERDAGEREAFVARACHGDAELRVEVESLLAHDSATDHFIDGRAIGAAAPGIARAREPIASGRRIDRYTVLSRIGAGGMGEVYLAEDGSLGRRVALKLLPESVADDAERLTRFKREARAASALNHPSIITVYEVGAAAGLHFIATEYVEGETLRDRLARGPLRPEEALEVAVRIAEALAAAHAAGILHRDVKPENVMVRPDGYVKVLDFGLAKVVGHADTRTSPTLDTEPGRLLGTVAYMSPEQLRGDGVDARTDVWSLGVLLFELASGTRPFAASSPVGVMTAILEREPDTAGAGALPAPLMRIVRRALEKDREQRYASAREMLEDLRAARSELEGRALQGPSNGSKAASERPLAASVTMLGRAVRARTGLAIVLVGLVAAAALAAMLVSRAGVDVAPPANEGPIRSIAVLPFLPLSTEARSESLELGMADTLITRLGGLQRLDVRPLSAVRPYMVPARDPVAAGRELKVQAVLDGSLQQAGDRLRVTLRLLRVHDGAAIWTAALDGHDAEIFDLQDAISEQIVAALRLELSRDEQRKLARRDTESSEAYNAYLKGRYVLDRRTEEWILKSIEHFSKAVELDPAYAPAHAGLADAYYELVYWAEYRPVEYMPKAKASAERALAIDDTLADAHTSLAIVLEDYEWRFAEAEQEYRRAIELDPKYALARQRLGQLLAEMGRFEESRAEHMAALEIDPLSRNVNMSLASLHFLSRDFEAAAEQLRRTLELDPTYHEARGFLGWIYVQLGAHDDAVRTWLGDSESDDARALRAAYERGGIRGYMTKDVELAKTRPRRSRSLPIFSALELAYLGRGDEALDVLEALCEERHSWLGELNVDPSWDGIRHEPRFIELVRRVGLSG